VKSSGFTQSSDSSGAKFKTGFSKTTKPVIGKKLEEESK